MHRALRHLPGGAELPAHGISGAEGTADSKSGLHAPREARSHLTPQPAPASPSFEGERCKPTARGDEKAPHGHRRPRAACGFGFGMSHSIRVLGRRVGDPWRWMWVPVGQTEGFLGAIPPPMAFPSSSRPHPQLRRTDRGQR